MNFAVSLVIGTLLLYIRVNDAETTTQAIKPPVANTTISSAAPPTTTTQRPKINVSGSALCKRCHCDTQAKVLDCSHGNLATFFTADEIEILQHGDIQFDTIRLDHNNLQTITAFPALPVKRLHLNNNKIDKIEKIAFKKLSNLQFLDLSHNQLTSKALSPDVFEGKYDPAWFEPLEHLKEINLSHNQLHTLDPDLFEHFPVLESLNLASNTFHVIDHLTEIAISSLLHLKTLDLSYMQLSTLPVHLLHGPSKSLENLQLVGNLFEKIPEALTFAVNLKSLNLDENLFKELSGENVFPRLSKLETLSISFLPDLKKIDKGAFSNLENLKEFIATNNPVLSYLHPNAFSRSHANETYFVFPPVEKLYLHNNNLTLLDKTLLERWDIVRVIDIRNNPWRCDCENHWLIHTLYPQIHEFNPTLSHHIDCAYPPEWKGAPIHDIHEKKKNLRCDDVYGNNPSKDGAILIGVMIGVLIGIPLTLGMIIIYRRGCFGWFGTGRPNDYSRAFYKRANFGEEY